MKLCGYKLNIYLEEFQLFWLAEFAKAYLISFIYSCQLRQYEKMM